MTNASIWADLHLHTTHSDGRHPPPAVIDIAAAAGLRAIAIVDHDTVSGLDEAAEAGAQRGVEVIPGIELTARWQGRTCHVLGYGIEPRHPRLVTALTAAEVVSRAAVGAALQALRARGYDLPPATLADLQAQCPTPNRLVLALVRRHLLRSRADLLALLPLLRVGAAGLPVQEAIAVVHAAGGAAVLAHPGRRSRGRLLDATALEDLAGEGLDGVEVAHPVHNVEDRVRYAAYADTLGLVATGGSDWHGRQRDPLPGTIGVDEAELARLRERIAARRAAIA